MGGAHGQLAAIADGVLDDQCGNARLPLLAEDQALVEGNGAAHRAVVGTLKVGVANGPLLGEPAVFKYTELEHVCLCRSRGRGAAWEADGPTAWGLLRGAVLNATERNRRIRLIRILWSGPSQAGTDAAFSRRALCPTPAPPRQRHRSRALSPVNRRWGASPPAPQTPAPPGRDCASGQKKITAIPLMPA